MHSLVVSSGVLIHEMWLLTNKEILRLKPVEDTSKEKINSNDRGLKSKNTQNLLWAGVPQDKLGTLELLKAVHMKATFLQG